MNRFVKSMLALSVTSAMTMSMVNAATYKVIDKGVASVKYTYAQHANNAGDMVLSGTNVYNFPVQFQYLTENDFISIVNYAFVNQFVEHELEPIEDYDALVAGNPTPNDLAWAVLWLTTKNGNYLYQEVEGTVVMLNSGDTSEEIPIFDVPFEGEDSPTRSTYDVVKGITSTSWIYGTASSPYLPEEFVNSNGDTVTYWGSDFSSRGFYSPDRGASVYSIIPPSEQNSDPTKNYGGVSGILDASETQIVVGFMSTEMNPNIQENLESETDSNGCNNPDVLDDVPKNICAQTYRDDGNTSAYQVRAFQATISASGETLTENLGLLVTPHEDDPRSYESYAQAVNDEGVVVGYSHGWVDEKETDPSTNQGRSLYAVLFKDGKVTSFAKDHNTDFDSRAYDINNAGIATGHVTKAINGKLRTKFYYIDTTNPDEMEMVFPTDFFDSSSSTARAINESGFIVGEGEVETHTDNSSNPRRTHAFIYDINNDVFTDVNDLLTCANPYSIIEARDINEDNVISASAIYKVQRRDATGELMVDDKGDPLMEDVVRAVTLEPMPDDGVVCTPEEEGKVVRQGASLGWLSLFTLFVLGVSRRFRKSN